jgi:hypothetical protein
MISDRPNDDFGDCYHEGMTAAVVTNADRGTRPGNEWSSTEWPVTAR